VGDPKIADNFRRLIEVHERKNADYSGQSERNYTNFEIAAQVMEWFDKPEDKVFACIIGIKIGRLASLLNSGKPANNESVEDTFDDTTVYTQLWKYGRADVKQSLE